MDNFRQSLPSRFFEVLERAEIGTSKQVLTLSVWDIKKLTNLKTEDIRLLKDVVAVNVAPSSITCDQLLKKNTSMRVTSGCDGIDKLLRGGFRRGTVTEIYGESGSGKTQIVLQAAVHNWSEGCVFICTEDVFPIKRFEQIKHSIPNYSEKTDHGQNIFVEHITEAQDLQSCAKVRLPKLLEKHKPAIIIIDSIAAPYRSEYSNYIQRAEDLKELVITLMSLAQQFNIAIVCINQVTASFSESEDVLPSLGLAWSNLVCTRLWLKKTNLVYNLWNFSPNEMLNCMQTMYLREITVVFAPDSPCSKASFIILPTGIQSVKQC